MPRGNGTGPGGMGPMTGRAAGYCAGYNIPGFANPISGRGFVGAGRDYFGGGGRIIPNMYYATGFPGCTGFGGAVPSHWAGRRMLPRRGRGGRRR